MEWRIWGMGVERGERRRRGVWRGRYRTGGTYLLTLEEGMEWAEKLKVKGMGGGGYCRSKGRQETGSRYRKVGLRRNKTGIETGTRTSSRQEKCLTWNIKFCESETPFLAPSQGQQEDGALGSLGTHGLVILGPQLYSTVQDCTVLDCTVL